MVVSVVQDQVEECNAISISLSSCLLNILLFTCDLFAKRLWYVLQPCRHAPTVRTVLFPVVPASFAFDFNFYRFAKNH